MGGTGEGRGGEKVTAGRSETKGGETERWRPDRKKLLALHFRLVAPRRANLSPKCKGGDLAGPGGGWVGVGGKLEPPFLCFMS